MSRCSRLLRGISPSGRWVRPRRRCTACIRSFRIKQMWMRRSVHVDDGCGRTPWLSTTCRSTWDWRGRGRRGQERQAAAAGTLQTAWRDGGLDHRTARTEFLPGSRGPARPHGGQGLARRLPASSSRCSPASPGASSRAGRRSTVASHPAAVADVATNVTSCLRAGPHHDAGRRVDGHLDATDDLTVVRC